MKRVIITSLSPSSGWPLGDDVIFEHRTQAVYCKWIGDRWKNEGPIDITDKEHDQGWKDMP